MVTVLPVRVKTDGHLYRRFKWQFTDYSERLDILWIIVFILLIIQNNIHVISHSILFSLSCIIAIRYSHGNTIHMLLPHLVWVAFSLCLIHECNLYENQTLCLALNLCRWRSSLVNVNSLVQCIQQNHNAIKSSTMHGHSTAEDNDISS